MVRGDAVFRLGKETELVVLELEVTGAVIVKDFVFASAFGSLVHIGPVETFLNKAIKIVAAPCGAIRLDHDVIAQ